MSWESGTRKETTLGFLPAPQTYTHLPEPLLSSELSRLSLATSVQGVDCVTLQPCPVTEPGTISNNEDRYVVETFDLPSGSWKLRAVFDGHAGQETSEFVHLTLPGRIKHALSSLTVVTPTTISDLLVSSIRSIDETIISDFLSLFPGKGSPEDIAKVSDDEIKSIINDGGVNLNKTHICMRGTTATVALIDPEGRNIWVASLGDSPAVLGIKDPSGTWHTRVLSSNHNGAEPSEADRVRAEHPNEPECIMEDRVLGAIAVTRALGDMEFKLPAIYTYETFLKAQPGFRTSRNVTEFMGRSLTPPYLSNIADVQHAELPPHTDKYLILSSDGLLDLYREEHAPHPPKPDALAERWVSTVDDSSEGNNRALALLRDGLGGNDEEKVSSLLTVELDFKWMDDTTVLVERL